MSESRIRGGSLQIAVPAKSLEGGVGKGST